MVVALKPGRKRSHAAHRDACNHWKKRIDHETGSIYDAYAMQLSMLNHMTEFSPVTKMELEEDVAYDFGSFDVRSFHRNLAKLIKLGWVERTEEFCFHTGAMTPVYRRLRRDDPPERSPRSNESTLPPINRTPVGPWPGYRVLTIAPATARDARDGGMQRTGWRSRQTPLIVAERTGAVTRSALRIRRLAKRAVRAVQARDRIWLLRALLLRIAVRPPSERSPDSRPPAASASPPRHPPSGARPSR